jgi:hypothetical protein
MQNQVVPLEEIQFLWLEGDSIDNTFEELQKIPFDKYLYKFDRQQPLYGSDANVERLKHLSVLGNKLIELYKQIPPTEFVCYIESDLQIITSNIFSRLMSLDKDIASPMVWLGDNFYDIWGFIDKNGEAFSPKTPFSSTLQDQTVVEILSSGSCLMMKNEVFHSGDFGTEAFRGFCSNARKKGYKIFVDRNASLRHPNNIHEGRRV